MKSHGFAATILLSLLVVTVLPVNADTITNIMPLGDSITWGDDDGGYREKLYLDLINAGFNVNFVGSVSWPNSPDPFFDTDHEGHPGWHADQIRDEVYDWLVENPAEIVLLHIGTNDISYGDEDVAEVEAILDEIDRYSTNVKVILARITLRTDDFALNETTKDFNDDIEYMAQERIIGGDDIVIVDMENALTYPDDMVENDEHPNADGYAKMADVWYDAIYNELITNLPIADFTGSPTSGTEPLTVTFTDASTSSDGIVSWLWNFGDGDTSSAQNPTHDYYTGTYTVSLTVTESDSDFDTETKKNYISANMDGIENFIIIVLPDTQYYSESYPAIFENQTQWIANNVDGMNVVFVSHEGDLVQDESNIEQWERADSSLTLLDGIVPWAVLPGNHDGVNVGGMGENLTNYNTYFPYSRFNGQSWYGGAYDDVNTNNYELFSGGYDDYLIFHFQYNPSDAVLAWANATLANYPNRRVIVTTHSYLNVDGLRTSEGNHIWNNFVAPHSDQIFLVLCGHMHGEARRTDVVNEHTVYQLLADYQEGYPNGGDGWLRMIDFRPAEDKIYVKCYSPFLNQYQTDADSYFILDYDMTSEQPIQTLNVENVMAWYWTDNTTINSVAEADVDDDGLVEIVSGGYYNDGERDVAQLVVWDGSALSVDRLASWYWTGDTRVNSVAVGNLDGDEALEIVSGGYYFDGTRKVAQLVAWDGATLAVDGLASWYWTGGTEIFSVKVADVDGDGSVEVVTGGYFNDNSRDIAQLVVWSGDLQTVENLATWYWTGDTRINSVAVGNVDADGQLEIVTGGYYNDNSRDVAQLVAWDGETLAVDGLSSWYWTGDTRINSVAVGNVDADGQLEIVTGGYFNDNSRDVAQLVVWSGDLQTVENLATWYWTGDTRIGSVSVDDVDSDGLAEIVTGGFYNDLSRDVAQLVVWEGGTLEVGPLAVWYWTGDTRINSVAVGNLDADASKEILTGGYYDDGVNLNSQLVVWIIQPELP